LGILLEFDNNKYHGKNRTCMMHAVEGFKAEKRVPAFCLQQQF
jgi:hypothetical protein